MKAAEDWIHFLRKYGPIAQNGNMFDEEIQRTAKQTAIRPITFDHPLAQRLLRSFNRSNHAGRHWRCSRFNRRQPRASYPDVFPMRKVASSQDES